MRHILTTSERARGGKSRAAQAAIHRKEFPTCYEEQARDFLVQLQPDRIEFEYPVETATNTVQYIDIAIWIRNKPIFIEVDGSHDWHNSIYQTKMLKYDELKAKYCHANNIPLIWINPGDSDSWRDMLCGIFQENQG